jgi:hypothetical protein
VPDRKQVQRQREQQRTAKIMASEGKKRSASVGKPSAPDMTLEEHQRRGDASDALGSHRQKGGHVLSGRSDGFRAPTLERLV